jgi:hypothetical protein
MVLIRHFLDFDRTTSQRLFTEERVSQGLFARHSSVGIQMQQSLDEIDSGIVDLRAVFLEVVCDVFLIAFFGSEIVEILIDLRGLIVDDHVVGVEVPDDLVDPLHLSVLCLFCIR